LRISVMERTCTSALQMTNGAKSQQRSHATARKYTA
jgi:hypothetical protein